MLHHILVTTIICGLYLTGLSESMRKNVCKSLEDYRTIQYNPNCWYNPDVGASPAEIARHHGYPFESYKVITQDGYILSLFRIPNNGSDDNNRKRPVVFLQHGIAADSTAWMTLGSGSLAFVLANNGYDVWISNSRGNKYSAKHVKYSIYDPKYWNFSFHELALYDLPAMLEFITAKTNQKGQITYIGHSMGSTMSFVYASLKPEEAQSNLKAIIALAPVAYMDHTNPLAKALAPFRFLIWDILTAFNVYGIGPNFQFKLDLIHNLCRQYPFIILCANVFGIAAGTNDNENREDAFPVVTSTFPSGLSLKSLMHYAQIIAAQHRFQMFDYGPEINWKIYNSTLPPEYPLKKIKVPVHLFYGKHDTVADEKDVLALYDTLETEKTVMEVFNFSHFNFLSAKRFTDFYNLLLEVLKRH